VLLFSSLCFGGLRGTPIHIQAALNACTEGNAAVRSGRLDTAIARFRDAIRIEPTYLDAFDGLIDALVKSGKPEMAAAALTELLQIEPDDLNGRLRLGNLLLSEGQDKRALAQFSFVLASEPDNADALFGFSQAARRSGMPDRASDAAEKGRRTHPLDARFRDN
jgi:tetratricopeptide (TPR) repeat protein